VTTVPFNHDRQPAPLDADLVTTYAQRLYDVALMGNGVEVLDVLDEAQQIGSDVVVDVVRTAIRMALASDQLAATHVTTVVKTGAASKGVRL
jgi:hypothetical protein